jgi:uncharacterized protein (DUF433 family)
LAGKPIILGTRISVEKILVLLADGWTNNQILEDYPMLKMRDIEAALKYAVETLRKARKTSTKGGRNEKRNSIKWMDYNYSRKKLDLR